MTRFGPGDEDLCLHGTALFEIKNNFSLDAIWNWYKLGLASVNDAQSGHHNLDLPIPFESIERVEVLHGSGSTLYGSDAVGGAVNFITASPVASGLRFGVAGGNLSTNSQNGSAPYLAKTWSEQITFTRDFSSGFMPDRDYRNFSGASETHLQTPLGDSTLLLGLSDRPFGANQFYGNFNSWERTKGWFAGVSQHIGDSTELALGYRRRTDEFILLRDDPQVYENNHVTIAGKAPFANARNLPRTTISTTELKSTKIPSPAITLETAQGPMAPHISTLMRER